MIEVIGTVCSIDNNTFRNKITKDIKKIQNKYKEDIVIDIQYSTCINTYGTVEYSALIIGRK